MGCGMSKSNLMDEGMFVFGSRSPLPSKPKPDPPNLLIADKSQASNLHQPPAMQKINTANGVHRDDNQWFGSPSFREYVKSVPDADAAATSGEKGGDETAIGKKRNGEVCVMEDSNGKEEADKKDTKGGRFRKVFQVQKVTFWHGRGWYAGYPKATTKAA